MIFSPGTKQQHLILDTSVESDRGKLTSDRWILAALIMIMMIGLVAVYSSIAYFAESRGNTASAMVLGHVVKLLIAVLVMIIVSKINYHLVAKFSLPALIMSWIFLLMVTLYGAEVWGAKRFLNVGGFSFQPSSLATVSLLIYLVVLCKQKIDAGTIKQFKAAFIPMMVYVSITCALIGIEDFSSAAVLMGLSLLVMFIGRVNTLHLVALVLVGVLGGGIILSQSEVRQQRITSYLEQVTDIKSDSFMRNAGGYQAQQAHIAIARGQLLGVGIGKSSQRNFLPAPYNDFIYAIIAEEYGLTGALFTLFLFTVILVRGVVYVARRATDHLGMMMAMVCTLTLVVYAYVNAAVATGLFPVTGLPMPFISYGGTSMLFSGLMMGILLNISKHRRQDL